MTLIAWPKPTKPSLTSLGKQLKIYFKKCPDRGIFFVSNNPLVRFERFGILAGKFFIGQGGYLMRLRTLMRMIVLFPMNVFQHTHVLEAAPARSSNAGSGGYSSPRPTSLSLQKAANQVTPTKPHYWATGPPTAPSIIDRRCFLFYIKFY
jgi:hypothetical protein